MKKVLNIEIKEPLIGLASDIVYGQVPFWCNATYLQLHLSLMKPRHYYDYDPKGKYPLLIFLCGGAFEQIDRCVWMGELSWFAKRGYAVACVEYCTHPRVKWPTQLHNVKQAIRFLRAHSEELDLIPDRFVIAGESAGAYLALATALTNGVAEYETGDYLDQSSAVGAVIAWYPAIHILGSNDVQVNIHVDMAGMPNLMDLITPGTPPVMLMHGTSDEQLSSKGTEQFYEKLIANHVSADLYILEGAHHNDAPFVQEEMKERMLDFMNRFIR